MLGVALIIGKVKVRAVFLTVGCEVEITALFLVDV